jgi:hypothetical protein
VARAASSNAGAGLEHHQSARHLTLHRVGDADHGALGDRRVRGEHLLHRAGRQAVPGHVDDVVGAAHHVQVTVVVEAAAVAGQVVTRVGGQVRRDVALVVLPQRRQAPGRQRQPDDDGAVGAGRHVVAGAVDDPHRIAGTGTLGEPAFVGIGSRPRRFATIGQPVSVCHQWSTTGMFSFSPAQA